MNKYNVYPKIGSMLVIQADSALQQDTVVQFSVDTNGVIAVFNLTEITGWSNQINVIT